MATEYRIIPAHTHRSNGTIKVPLLVGKQAKYQYASLTEVQAIELIGQLVQGIKGIAKTRIAEED